ncbi:MAG: hypothetical protein QNK35_02000 [Bacteroides sp.]|nr:hypothetical protein [Bacteroides sp.]
MYTNQISTNRAGPAAILIPDKLPDAHFLYLHQILYHTHAIFFAISLIQVFQAPAWKGSTGRITVFTITFSAETQHTLPAAFGVRCQAALTFIPVSKISNAKPAIHTTWRYLRYPDGCFHLKYS